MLVTGATGSGKSTTLAAMLNWINRNRKQHIVTIEDPIEFIHDDWASIVNQREVGLDTESFQQALRRVLRQDPDVILIGELRDEETAQTALQAAESGHLVFSTLHTLDAAETIGRLVEFYPPAEADDGAGDPRRRPAGRRQPAPHPAQGGRPRRGHRGDGQHGAHRRPDPRAGEDARPITEAIEDGAYHHMQSFSQHLVQLVVDDVVELEVAAAAATNRHDFEIAVEQALRDEARRRGRQDRRRRLTSLAEDEAEPEPEERVRNGTGPAAGDVGP